MEQILSYFIFDKIEIIGLSFFFLFFLLQIFYYVIYYRKPLIYARKQEEANREGRFLENKPKVSVIIESENEAYRLEKSLPLILEQDYPDFEVIVVNNGSTDESYDLLQSLRLKYPNLYHTYVPNSSDRSFGRRKLALTLGIKAAKGDVLLFTEPYSQPVSDQWISLMVKNLKDDKEVALGYSYYRKSKSFFNRIARFDNHLFSMQYLSMAIRNKPFIGVYRNVAFRKSLFFDNKGFASFLGLESGEVVFLNQILTRENTVVVASQDSFIETNMDNSSLWKQIKKSYSSAKPHFKGKAVKIFALEYFSRYVFYLALVGLVAYSAVFQNWALLGIVLFIFLLRLILQLVVLNKSASYFCSGKFHFSLLVADVFQPIYNLKYRSRQRRFKR
ncbi:glycosyltransferase [Dysgonomonas sp. ZJ709]|uniref:glycosyltransferase n=1 Tax=Dysgonomonas sp. ZJ709 TaxID=2709797 RepID=UPI0013EC7FD3|nr:glycosyltransferase [Dysgonomonas sp. ZJ709]